MIAHHHFCSFDFFFLSLFFSFFSSATGTASATLGTTTLTSFSSLSTGYAANRFLSFLFLSFLSCLLSFFFFTTTAPSTAGAPSTLDSSFSSLAGAASFLAGFSPLAIFLASDAVTVFFRSFLAFLYCFFFKLAFFFLRAILSLTFFSASSIEMTGAA